MDGCGVEYLKSGDTNVIEWLVRLLISMIVDWASACVVSLCKSKGDNYKCTSFSGISLYGRVLMYRIREDTEDVICQEQCCFRRWIRFSVHLYYSTPYLHYI